MVTATTAPPAAITISVRYQPRSHAAIAITAVAAINASAGARMISSRPCVRAVRDEFMLGGAVIAILCVASGGRALMAAKCFDSVELYGHPRWREPFDDSCREGAPFWFVPHGNIRAPGPVIPLCRP